jgi:hypothetical protein
LNDGGGITIKDKNKNSVVLSGSGDITTTVSNNSTEKGVTINTGSTHTVNVGSKEGGGLMPYFRWIAEEMCYL